MVDSRYAEFLRAIGFTLIQPETARGPDRRFAVARNGKPAATLLEIPGTPIDAVNATLGPDTLALYRTLRPLCDIPRMSSLAVAAIINQGVRRMTPGSAFVNVGVWNGFSLLSGMAANPDTPCIGVDNFSERGGPREAFLKRFERRRGPQHHFHYMDYEDYFANHHRGQIGLYLYDGDHAYEHQVRGLQIAEPFFSDDCVVIVDDTNMTDPREGTLDFIAESDRDYELLLDSRTAENGHPTFWNGIMVLQATSTSEAAASTRPPDPGDAASRGGRHGIPIRVAPDSLVSLVVWDPEPEPAALEATIERALAQTWPHVEVLVVNQSPDEHVAEIIRGFEDRVVSIPASSEPGVGPSAGVASSGGDFVGLVDARSDLDEAAVEMALALPRLVRFDRGAVSPHRHLRAGHDIDRAIPEGEAYILVGESSFVAQTIGAGPALALDEQGEDLLDDATALARIEKLSVEGTRFVVFLWTAFSWLSDHPLVERRLRSEGRCLTDNDRVLIFELIGTTSGGRRPTL
jgi:Methyltransferase domain